MKRTYLNVPLEGELAYEDRYGWEKSRCRPLTFNQYVERLADKLYDLDLYVDVVNGRTRDGLKILVVGLMHYSRLIAVHPADPRGVIHILEDHGQAPSPDFKYRAVRAVTFTRLTEAGLDSVNACLELGKHEYNRFDEVGRLEDDYVLASDEDFRPTSPEERKLMH